MPSAFTWLPTQRYANDGVGPEASVKAVVVATSTVTMRSWRRGTIVKLPDAPATPQDPEAAEPFTEVTIPAVR